jgi:hypothetical protein
MKTLNVLYPVEITSNHNLGDYMAYILCISNDFTIEILISCCPHEVVYMQIYISSRKFNSQLSCLYIVCQRTDIKLKINT